MSRASCGLGNGCPGGIRHVVDPLPFRSTRYVWELFAFPQGAPSVVSAKQPTRRGCGSPTAPRSRRPRARPRRLRPTRLGRAARGSGDDQRHQREPDIAEHGQPRGHSRRARPRHGSPFRRDQRAEHEAATRSWSRISRLSARRATRDRDSSRDHGGHRPPRGVRARVRRSRTTRKAVAAATRICAAPTAHSGGRRSSRRHEEEADKGCV